MESQVTTIENKINVTLHWNLPVFITPPVRVYMENQVTTIETKLTLKWACDCIVQLSVRGFQFY